ncbi:MAG: PorP/SprF family type IX secretion system membrane protein [Bacteroidota bacterium]
MFALIALTNFIKAQDIHYAQYNYSPLNAGGAFSSLMNADFRMSANNRKQWNAVTIPYQTLSIGAEEKLNYYNNHLNNFTGGILINQDKAGDGAYRTLNCYLSIGYQFQLNKDSDSWIAVGVSPGFSQKSIDFNKLSFDNQFLGDLFNPAAPTGENPNTNKLSYFDLGSSILLHQINGQHHFYIGYQLNHINRPKQNFYSTNITEQAIHHQVLIGDIIQSNHEIVFLPSLLLARQNRFIECLFGAEIILPTTKKSQSISGGLHYRIKDAIIPSIAINYNKFRIGLSYDINISSLKTASHNKGGAEISIIYQTLQIKAQPQRKTICPIY